MLSKFTHSLRASILLVVSTGFIVPTLVIAPLLFSQLQHETSQRIALQLEQYANILALGAREPLWNLSPDALRPLVEALLNNPDVMTVEVIDQTAGPLIQLDRRQGLSSTPLEVAERKVFYRGRELGKVSIGLTGDSVRRDQQRRMLALIGMSLVQLALAAVLIVWFLRRRLVQPLEILGHAADQLARGELQHPIEQSGRDEIGRLAARLETTRGELLRLFADLGEKNTALARELAERLQAESARRELEARLQTVFAMASTAMAVARQEDCTLLMVNPAWEAVFGWSEGEVLGRNGNEIKLWSEPDTHQRLLALLAQYGRISGEEVRMLRRDGSELLIEASARPFRSGGSDLLAWNLRDITTAKAAAEALRESEQRFAALFHHAPVALCILDIDAARRIIDVNTQFEHDFQRPRGACAGQPLAALSLWDSESDAEAFARLLERGGEGDKTRVWARSPQGQRACYELAGREVVLRGRRSFIWSALDVTPIIQAKASMEEANRSLEDKVARRTRDLETANRELAALLGRLQGAQAQLIQSEKLAALGSLVAGIAHELNTPIGNGLMVASTLDEQHREFLQRIEGGLRRSDLHEFVSAVGDASGTLMRNLHRAADLVASFKQVAVDQTSSQRRQFDLRELVREIEITLAPSFRKARCRFINQVDEGIQLDSFPGPLGQVITNLATNAIAHAFDGREGGEFTVFGEPIDASRIRMRFCDNGEGIVAENLLRIFDPFFTTKLGRGGSGLGLHIVYNIVTGALGGHIHAESTPGQGACFVLNLPRQAPFGETEASVARDRASTPR